MKTISKILASALVLTLANKSFGQSTAQGTATATIVEPISIAATRALAFGSVAKGASGGTVIVTPASSRTGTGDVTLVTSTSTSATFTVTGDVGRDFYIQLPADNVVTIVKSGGSDDMHVDGFNSDKSVTRSTLSGTIGSGGTGTLTFNVGATLTVKASQAPGTYTGTFPVTVNYL